jgi:hypothetical protein
MMGHSSVAGALAANGTASTGVGYKTIYNQQKGSNELSSNSHLKPPSNANASGTGSNRSPRIGRVRGVSPQSREKPTPGNKSTTSSAANVPSTSSQ